MPQEGSQWTVRRLLDWTAPYFSEKGIPSARLDAELLLSHVLKQQRLWLYMNHDMPLKEIELEHFRGLVQRRGKGEPAAYILGEKEFWSRSFLVGPGVLVPRPETEGLIECALTWYQDNKPETISYVDLGCGSGVLAITLGLELLGAGAKLKRAIACDISLQALQFTRKNAQRHEFEGLDLLQSNFLSSLQGRFDLIVSNPPYIALSEREGLPRDVKDYEPEEALFSGKSGLEALEKIMLEGKQHLAPQGQLLLEIGQGQSKVLLEMAAGMGYAQVELIPDLAGIDRVMRLSGT